MKYQPYPKRDAIKNYFPLPNEFFTLGLGAGEISVYSYPLYLENRKTFQCWPSYKTIGKAMHMSNNTVRKYVLALEVKALISTIEQRDEPEDDLQADSSPWQIVDEVYDDTLPLGERDKAVEDLKTWAEDGDPTAQYFLGKRYLTGRDMQYDKELALHWLPRAADQGNEYAQFFLDRADSFRPPSVMLAATRLLHHMANVFRDNSLPKTGTVGFKLDKKQLQKLREKKIAMGHKPDDHEEYADPTMRAVRGGAVSQRTGGIIYGKTTSIRRRHGAKAGGRPLEGRIVVDYDDNGYPKTKNVLAKTKSECLEKLRTLKETCGDPKSTRLRPEMPFGDWLTYWYEHHSKPKLRPTTQANYEGCIRRQHRPGHRQGGTRAGRFNSRARSNGSTEDDRL